MLAGAIAPRFSGGPARMPLAGKWGFIDGSGQVVIPPLYDRASDFSDGLAAVELGGKWGFIDAGGRTVIPPQFDSQLNIHSPGLPLRFSAGLAVVSGPDKWGYIDKTGKYVWGPVKYPSCRSCWFDWLSWIT